jgi:hypothetical protein
LLLLLQMAATLEEIREKNRQLAESNLSKQNAINEVRHSTSYRALYCRKQQKFVNVLRGG